MHSNSFRLLLLNSNHLLSCSNRLFSLESFLLEHFSFLSRFSNLRVYIVLNLFFSSHDLLAHAKWSTRLNSLKSLLKSSLFSRVKFTFSGHSFGVIESCWRVDHLFLREEADLLDFFSSSLLKLLSSELLLSMLRPSSTDKLPLWNSDRLGNSHACCVVVCTRCPIFLLVV